MNNFWDKNILLQLSKKIFLELRAISYPIELILLFEEGFFKKLTNISILSFLYLL